mgnify:CR=1 FL=1|tara:strand:- start:443 stop:757 length:315 start_codon:yes stop_codon:yes gene_type:complete
MSRKQLQKDSAYDEYDSDGDGIVTDEELAHVTEIKKLEHDLRKQRAQRRMATASLVAMGSFTLAMFFVDIERVKALSDISNLFYISGAGIVGAYMGVSAFMNKK